MLLMEHPSGVNAVNKTNFMNYQNYIELWIQEISFDWY